MNSENPYLSIIIPIYNEFEILDLLKQRLIAAAELTQKSFELIFVNDGSKDQSIQKIKAFSQEDQRIQFINFSRNFGHQISVAAGLDHCRGQVVVIIDGDLQDPPELIPEMLQKYNQGYEVVYAKRKKRAGETWFKKKSAKWFYRLLDRITDIEIPVDVGDFRLIDRKIVEALKQMPEQNKFFRGQIAWLGFKQTEVLYERDERTEGETGYPLKKMINFALDGITAFSDAPLKLATKLGFFVSFLAFAIIIYALVAHFVFHQTLTGWTSLIISSMFIGGIQLFTIGILGEYMSRINKNVQNRPLYLISESSINKNDTKRK